MAANDAPVQMIRLTESGKIRAVVTTPVDPTVGRDNDPLVSTGPYRIVMHCAGTADQKTPTNDTVLPKR